MAEGRLNVDNFFGSLAQDAGTLVVGNSSSTTAITGDYTLNASGMLEIELANSGGVPGIDFDPLEITGDATLTRRRSTRKWVPPNAGCHPAHRMNHANAIRVMQFGLELFD